MADQNNSNSEQQQQQSGALSRAEYAALVAKLNSVPAMACPNFKLLQAQHPSVPLRTMLGLFAQEAQHRAIRAHHHLKAAAPAHCARYRQGADVLDLCGDADLPACLMLRRMLEHMLGLGKQRVGDVLRDPSLLATDAAPVDAGAAKGAAAADAALLARLRADIVRCARADRAYSPLCDMAKGLAGLEHEAALYAELRRAGVPHWTEADLRARGMYKTPDALLQVPVAIRCPLTGRWHIVHWLDSKACFGDDRLHAAALEGQYATYTNRYGSGAVVYWLGFVRDLAAGGGGGDGDGIEGDGCGGGTEGEGGGNAGGGGDDGAPRGINGSGAAMSGGSGVLLLERFPPPADVRLLTTGPPSPSDDVTCSSSSGIINDERSIPVHI